MVTIPSAKFEALPKKMADNWHIIAAIILLLFAFWVRSFPSRFGELQGLDDFYIYRMSEYYLNHNFRLPDIDIMRNAPYGVEPKFDPPMTYYLPAIIYSIFSSLGLKLNYLHWAILWPAIGGAIAVFIIFFIGKEIFRSRLAGMFASLIAAASAAFINRTAAGNFEKEGTAVIFWMLCIYFFVRAYRSGDWRKSMVYGALAGLNLAVMHLAWGGADFVLLLLSAFTFLLAIIDKASRELAAGFGIMVAAAIILTNLTLNKIQPTETGGLFALATIFILIARFAAEKYNLVKREYLPYLAVSIMIAGTVALSALSLFIDVPNPVMKVFGLISYRPGVELSTVAESQPGSLDEVANRNSLSFAKNSFNYIDFLSKSPPLLSILGPIFDFLAPVLSPWTLVFPGLLIMAYIFFRKRDYLLFLPAIWLLSSAYSVLIFIRLIIFTGPAAALVAGFFIAWIVKTLVNYSQKSEARNQYLRLAPVFSALLLSFLAITINAANGYAYGHMEGPSVCIPGLLQGGEKCIKVGEKGEYIFAKNQPWYEAFEFMAKQTPANSNFLSWWDFGYWFQTRGERPSVTDGGWGFREEVADWFAASPSEWANFTWLKERNVSYIFMDYTLPGKYGAISKISSRGTQIVGMMSFQRTNQFSRDNTTIIEFSAGPFGDGLYRHIWLPITGDSFRGPIRFLASKGDGQYIPQGTITDVCTNSGIIHVSNESANGCVALSDIGVFLVPSVAENTVFSSLMFMDGHGLPVEKVYESSAVPGAFPRSMIKIFRILN
ncbi:MAG: glycosyltransferase family 39 protein [Candidatus Aenigmarchaeota archaeon]|nr:glycosyltransferase family 39 protein [Candidatus Aenigmarchaeota archaeon]